MQKYILKTDSIKKLVLNFLFILNVSALPLYASAVQTDEVDLHLIGNYKVQYASTHITNFIDHSGYGKNKTREMISEIATKNFYMMAFGFDTEESKIDGNRGIDLFYEDDYHFSGDTYVIVHECKFHGKGGKPKLSKNREGVRQMSTDWLASVAKRACDDDNDSVEVCVSMENVNENTEYAIRLANVFENNGTNTFYAVVDRGADFTQAEAHFHRLLTEKLSSYSINWGSLKEAVEDAL